MNQSFGNRWGHSAVLEWHSAPLGDLTTKIGSGITPRGGKEAYVEYGTSLIRSQNVLNEGFSKTGLAFVTDLVAAEMKSVTVEPDDVLLNITGDSVARACQVDRSVLPARVNQHVAIIRTKQEQLSPRYLRYVLVDPAMQARLLGLASAGATRPALTKGMIERLEVPLPPLGEQQSIADVLGALDDKIELNRKTTEALEVLALATFQSWFVDFYPVHVTGEGLTLVGMDSATAAPDPAEYQDSLLGPIPVGWRVGSVIDIATLNELTLSSRDDLPYIDYIEISEVTHGTVGNVVRYERSQAPSRAKRRLRHGDTALSTVRPDRGSHFLTLDPGEFDIASTGFVVLTPRHDLWAFLYSAVTQPRVGEYLGRLADGGAYPAVRPEVVGALPLALPPSDRLLSCFQELAAPLYEKAHHGRKENRQLASIRDYLLPKLLSGEVRVRDAERLVP